MYNVLESEKYYSGRKGGNKQGELSICKVSQDIIAEKLSDLAFGMPRDTTSS